jgi:hypothetical protein
MSDLKVIVLQESWLVSAARDATTVVCGFTLILPGWLMGSDALQWLGFLFVAAIVFSRAAGLRRKHERTLDEAKAEIEDMIRERDAA